MRMHFPFQLGYSLLQHCHLISVLLPLLLQQLSVLLPLLPLLLQQPRTFFLRFELSLQQFASRRDTQGLHHSLSAERTN